MKRRETMKRLTVKELRHYMHYDVTAIRIKNGDFYFLGWNDCDYSENSEVEKIFATRSSEGIKLEKDRVMLGSLYDAIMDSDDYNGPLSMQVVTGNMVQNILSLINPHDNDKDDYDIFIFSKTEFQEACDSLGDGDYLIVGV